MNTTPDRTDRTAAVRAWSPGRRFAALIAATMMLLTAVVNNAEARAGGFVETSHTEGLFYGDFDLEIALFAGGTVEDFCTGSEPTHDARLFERNDGTIEIMVDASRQPIYLYATPLGGPELVAASCAALADGDPTTSPLQPFAEGEGLVRMRIEIAPDGTVGIVNSAVGSAASTDGTTWLVRGWADLTVVDGVPVGSPSEFQGIRIRRTGH